jgi:tetratricopeptide (TPR) repeat protein
LTFIFKTGKDKKFMQSESHPLSPSAAQALRLYAGYRATDQHVEALRAASEACHEAPQAPQPHYAYGEAWLALGQHANAVRAFAEAVRLAPDWPDAWVNLGVAHYRQGAIEDAKTAMRQVLARAPGHPVAAANLAAFMRLTGEGERAELLLQDLLARAPDSVGARLNLVADLLLEGRPEEALGLLDASPGLPADASVRRHWLLQRSLTLLQLKRLDEAAGVLGEVAALGPMPPAMLPSWHWRHLLLADLRGDPAAAEHEARLMEQALPDMGPQAVPEHRIMGHYDLARFWSGRGRHGRAFDHWHSAHALLKVSQPFSRAVHEAFVDASIAAFDARCQKACASNDDRTPLFIVGMPRSGTTLCEQILAAHPQVHGAGERAALGAAFERLAGSFDDPAAPGRIAALTPVELDGAAAQYLAELHALAPQKRRIIDKMPGNYLALGLAARLLPGARFIHCVRDPRDIGFSIFTFRFHGLHPYAHDLADIGWMIGQHQRLMTHWKRILPRRILRVALEDWVRDFGGTLARVLKHVGLEHDPACERFHERDVRVRTVSRHQVREPVNARGLGRWRAHADALSPLIAELEHARCLPYRRR